MTTPHAHRHGPPPDAPPARVEEVGDGVHAYLQPDGSWFLNNCAFVVGRDGVVLVDTTSTEWRTRALLEAVAGVTERPVRTVVNTHSHGDHTHGNYLLPLATIVAHDLCRPAVLEAGTSSTAMFPEVDWGELRVAAPFVTFADRLTVWVDDLRVELVHTGAAHTTNDVYAWIPEQRVLLAGDLVFNGGCPFVMMGSVAGSLDTVAELRALGPEVVVPGHGPVGGPELLDEVEDYLRFVDLTARAGFEAGRSPLEAAREADLGRFAAWGETERLAPNLHRAYSELRGEPRGTPLGIGTMIADMVAFNGGRLPHCLA